MSPPGAIEVTAVTDTQGATLPNPLDINGVAPRRTKAGRMVAGVAAPVNVEGYKGYIHSHKPLAKRWDCKWVCAYHMRHVY
jgi:aromatic amino acid aminotransferase I